MDDRKLETLLATIRTGSFSKAAGELCCTQSAVTQMMNSLESELGCRILERNHNGVKLTDVGENLLPYIIEADASLTRLMKYANRLAEGKTIPIRIGSFSSISNTWLPKVIQLYQNTHPDVSFDIRIGSNYITDWLLNGEIDLALGDEDRCRAFRWYPLLEDSYYAVMPKQLVTDERDTISQEEFAQFPLIMAPLNVLEKHLDGLVNRKIDVTCDDDSTLLNMVSQGFGVTAMPGLSLWNVPDNVRILNLNPVPRRVLGVALPNSPRKAAKEFANFLKEYFQSATP